MEDSSTRTTTVESPAAIARRSSVQVEEPRGLAVDGYRVGRKIAEGGMGQVFHATVADGAPGDAALKVIRPELVAHDAVRELFAREARVLRLTRHPHLLRLLTAGDCELGPYLLTEFIPGQRLDRLVDETGPLPALSAAQILIQLCDAVATLHAHHILHLDVKPGNVLVRRRGDMWFAKLIDFGLARRAAAYGAGTAASDGTPPYMAPERLAGAPATAAMDVFSLGVLAFELLTGQLPYSDLQKWPRSWGPPSFASLHVRSGARLLEKTVLAAMRDDPRERPTMVELRNELQALTRPFHRR